jgi:uncharacterized peroxidase-related enzyme
MFIDTTPPDAATGAVREMYERQQRSWGYVPNYAMAFTHRPEVMTAWAGLLSSIRRNVDPRRFELVTLAAAHHLGNSYCSLAHARALGGHLSPGAIHALLTGGETDAVTVAERAMMAFAGQVARDAAAVTAGDVAKLRAHGFTDAEIFDIVAVAAARAFFTKVLDGLGVQADADEDYRAMDESLRATLMVGRPIAEAAVQRLP